MLKIGEFSRLSQVSVRMLRHYHQLGLLRPAHTDTSTSYRFYSAEQLPRLNRILAFQDLGFSLEQIRQLLDENLSADELHGMLRLKRAEVERNITEDEMRLARLEARLSQMEALTQKDYDVILRAVAPELAATLREVVSDDERIQSMFNELETYVEEHDEARADRPSLTIYHDMEYRERDIDAEVAVPLKLQIPGIQTIQVRELPALTQAACVIHTGSYAGLYQAYNALLSLLERAQYQIAGPIREVYLGYGADGLGFTLPPTYLAEHPEKYVTELQMPVERR